VRRGQSIGVASAATQSYPKANEKDYLCGPSVGNLMNACVSIEPALPNTRRIGPDSRCDTMLCIRHTSKTAMPRLSKGSGLVGVTAEIRMLRAPQHLCAARPRWQNKACAPLKFSVLIRSWLLRACVRSQCLAINA